MWGSLISRMSILFHWSVCFLLYIELFQKMPYSSSYSWHMLGSVGKSKCCLLSWIESRTACLVTDERGKWGCPSWASAAQNAVGTVPGKHGPIWEVSWTSSGRVRAWKGTREQCSFFPVGVMFVREAEIDIRSFTCEMMGSWVLAVLEWRAYAWNIAPYHERARRSDICFPTVISAYCCYMVAVNIHGTGIRAKPLAGHAYITLLAFTSVGPFAGRHL